jgi:hypothetical protein
MDFNHIDRFPSCADCYATPNTHMDEFENRGDGGNALFSLCRFDTVTNGDLFHLSPSRLDATTSCSTLSLSCLLHPFLNSPETRIQILRPLFKEVVLHTLKEVAVLLCDTTELCRWRPEVDNNNGTIHSSLSEMLSIEIPTYAWQDGTAKIGKTETLMLLVEELSQHLQVQKDLTVDDLVDDQTAINACRCIAKTLKSSPRHDLKRVLGACAVIEALFCKITSRNNLEHAPSLTDHVWVVKETQYAKDTRTNPPIADGRCAVPAARSVERSASDTEDCNIIGQSFKPWEKIIWLTQEHSELQRCHAF